MFTFLRLYNDKIHRGYCVVLLLKAKGKQFIPRNAQCLSCFCYTMSQLSSCLRRGVYVAATSVCVETTLKYNISGKFRSRMLKVAGTISQNGLCK